MIKKKRGVALITVIMIFAVVTILGTVLLSLALSQMKVATHSALYDNAYNQAWSSVEVVAKDISERIKKIEELSATLQASTTSAEFEANNLNYQAAVDFLNNNIIGHTVTLTAENGREDNVADKVIVTKSEDNVIYIQSTKVIDDVSATATMKFASYSVTPKSVTIVTPGTAGESILDNTIYLWGDLVFTGIVIVTNTEKINISYGGSMPNDFLAWIASTLTNITFTKVEELPEAYVQQPPAELWEGKTPKSRMAYNKTITSADNGYYSGNYQTYLGDGNDSQNITWVVDTTSGNVILIFDYLLNYGNVTISVKGNNKCFIYLLGGESGGSTLVNITRSLNIKKYSIFSTARPAAYIISYDKQMRDGAGTGGNSKIIIDEQASVYGYLYMPYTDITVNGGLTLQGSVFAGNVTIHGTTILEFIKPPDTVFGGTFAGSGSTTEEKSYDEVSYSGDSSWVKEQEDLSD